MERKMNLKIGTTPDSWGVWFVDDPKQPPYSRFLDEAAEAGYEWIEISPFGYLPTDLKKLTSELDKRGLKACSSFSEGCIAEPSVCAELENELPKVAELLAAFGALYIGVIDEHYRDSHTGKQIMPGQLDETQWKYLIDNLHRLGKQMRERFGISLLYHNEFDTRIETREQLMKLLDRTDPELVNLCFDTGHYAYLEDDTVDFLREYHHRIPYIHIKNVDKQVQKKMRAENWSPVTAVGSDLFCEPSRGVIDFNAFFDVLNEINYDSWVIVEQDMYGSPWDKSLPIAKRTRDYLRDIGIG